jgi:hypothetical protein
MAEIKPQTQLAAPVDQVVVVLMRQVEQEHLVKVLQAAQERYKVQEVEVAQVLLVLRQAVQ